MRHLDRHPTGERHVALLADQALTGRVDGDERCRTGGLNIDRRTAQVEQVRHARREEVLVVARVAHQKQADRRHQLRVREQVIGHVGVHARATEHADAAAEGVRHVPRVLERLPGHFEEMPVLRVHDRRFARAEAEEARVEELHIVERCADFDVVGVVQEGSVDAGGPELGIREPSDGFNAARTGCARTRRPFARQGRVERGRRSQCRSPQLLGNRRGYAVSSRVRSCPSSPASAHSSQ